MRTLIYSGGEWIEGAPVDGEKVKYQFKDAQGDYSENSATIETYYHEEE